MAGKFGRERLKTLVENQRVRASATPLYRWLLTNREDISALRSKGDAWAPYVEAARQDGLDLPDEKDAMKRIERYWRRMGRTHHDQPKADEQERAAQPSADKAPPPSRMPANWRPAIGAASSDTKKDSSVAGETGTLSPVPSTTSGGDAPLSRGRRRVEEMKKELRRAQREREPGFYRE